MYVDNPTLLYSGGINYISDQVKEEAWYKAIAGKNVTQPIVMRTGKNGQLDSFSIIRSMNYFSSQDDHTKYLKIDMRMPSIRQIMSNLNVQGKVYLLSGAGNIEYTTDPKVDIMQGSVPYSKDRAWRQVSGVSHRYVHDQQSEHLDDHGGDAGGCGVARRASVLAVRHCADLPELSASDLGDCLDQPFPERASGTDTQAYEEGQEPELRHDPRG